MLSERLQQFVRENNEFHEWKHASAIPSQDFADEWIDLLALLQDLRLRKSWISVGGGNKSKLASYLDSFLVRRGWVEKQFLTAIEVDGHARQRPPPKARMHRAPVAKLRWKVAPGDRAPCHPQNGIH